SSYGSASPSTTFSACLVKNQNASPARMTPPLRPIASGRKCCRRLPLRSGGFSSFFTRFFTSRSLWSRFLKRNEAMCDGRATTLAIEVDRVGPRNHDLRIAEPMQVGERREQQIATDAASAELLRDAS